MRRAAGPVPVAGGSDDLAVLADSEDRRGEPAHPAFLDVIGVGCHQEPLQARVIQVQRPGDAATRLGTEVCRIQVSQGRRAADLGDAQPATPYVAINPRNPANLIGVYQEDRYPNDGANGVLASVSFNGGLS